MGEKNDELKYMEGNYSKNPFQEKLEYEEDRKQAEQLQMQEYYLESYLNAVEKLRKEHHYLVDGAVLRCSKSTTNPIKITQSKGQILKYEECTEDMLVGGAVVLEDPENMECFRAPEGKSEVRLKVLQNKTAINGSGQCFATVKDTKKGGIGYYFDHDTDDYNIRFFGNCMNAPDRDDECKAIIMAAESTKLRNIGTCPYLMKLNDEWENFVSDVNYEEVMALDGELSELITMEAVLFCKHGGFIYPVDSGYIPTETEEEEKELTLEEQLELLMEQINGDKIKTYDEMVALPTVEILARLIYQENHIIGDPQNQVVFSIVNRLCTGGGGYLFPDRNEKTKVNNIYGMITSGLPNNDKKGQYASIYDEAAANKNTERGFHNAYWPPQDEQATQEEQDAWENAKWLAALLYYSVEEFGIGEEKEKGKCVKGENLEEVRLEIIDFLQKQEDIKGNKIINTIGDKKNFRAGANGQNVFN